MAEEDEVLTVSMSKVPDGGIKASIVVNVGSPYFLAGVSATMRLFSDLGVLEEASKFVVESGTYRVKVLGS